MERDNNDVIVSGSDDNNVLLNISKIKMNKKEKGGGGDNRLISVPKRNPNSGVISMTITDVTVVKAKNNHNTSKNKSLKENKLSATTTTKEKRNAKNKIKSIITRTIQLTSIPIIEGFLF